MAATPSIVLNSELLGEWEPMLAPIVAPLLRAAQDATSFADVQERLRDLHLDSAELVKRLERATAISRGLGDVGQ
jgi:hypothetical protein